MNKRKFLSLKYLLAFFTLIFCVFSFSPALMIKLSLKKLTIKSDAIILGKVKEIQSQWSMDKSVILTIVKLHVQEVLKGRLNNNQILIQYPGGEVGDIGLKVSDTPTFNQNEKVLVFLKSITDIQNAKHSPVIIQNLFPAFSIFGAAQGKYSVDKNGIAHKSGFTLISENTEQNASIPLDIIKRKIERILNQNLKEREKANEKIKH